MKNSREIFLNDQFVLDTMRAISGRIPSLNIDRGRMSGIQQIVVENGPKIISHFCKHYCVSLEKMQPLEILTQLDLLRITWKILGVILESENSFIDIKHIIEADWKAHIEIDKEKRYRDHITHPVRVTALGWWLLHRNHGRLLERMADYYEKSTGNYRKDRDIGINSWWSDHPCKESLAERLTEFIEDNTTDFRSFSIGNDRRVMWMTIVQYAWLACGLLHDSAYPLEYQLRCAKTLHNRFGSTFPVLGPAVGRFPKRESAQAFLKPLEGSWFKGQMMDLNARLDFIFSPRSRNGNPAFKLGKTKGVHAIIGALHQVLSIGKKIHSVKGLVFQIAARGIATHHDEEISSIKNDEIAQLLYVSDGLQAWNRPFLHREPALEDGTRRIRPIIECRQISLEPEGDGYIAKFTMNNTKKDRKILTMNPYSWEMDKFTEPYQRLEQLLGANDLYPQIILCQDRCIQPKEFFEFMHKHADS